ncbi:hypothetical protein FQN51_003365 [Onygenales sp. PD_10]|nr:hypothetical protein FQN51_003365 [Onygenales sp. PD_10]
MVLAPPPGTYQGGAPSGSSDLFDSTRSLYVYEPKKVAPIVFTVMFILSGIFHFWQCYRYKFFKVMFLHIVCCLMFTAGFALRIYGSHNYTFTTENINVYIASTCLIYMCPPLLELANYHVLGRILYYIPYCSPLHPGRVLTTFGLLSAVVEAMNAIGVAYLASPKVSETKSEIGHALTKASLIVQLAVIAAFCALAILFQRRCARHGISSRKVTTGLVTLYTSMFLILGRCVYRTVEHFAFTPTAPGAQWRTDPADLNPIIKHEWFFYVFEAALMLTNSTLWNGSHPHRYLPADYNIYLARDGVSEMVGPGWEDDRSFFITLLDPFGWIWKTEKKAGRPFWETDGVGGKYEGAAYGGGGAGAGAGAGGFEGGYIGRGEEADRMVEVEGMYGPARGRESMVEGPYVPMPPKSEEAGDGHPLLARGG